MNSKDVWSFYDAVGDADRNKLTPIEKQAAAICDLRQEVNSGGFDSYFRYWGGNTALVARAPLASLLGEPWADLLDDALALFGDHYPLGPDDRADVLDRHDWQDVLNALDERFYALEASTDADERLSRALGR